jgi:uncharacterized protein YdhG (YjbR/CyaY superfamily)
MDTTGTKFDNIDKYIAGFPEETQELLEQIRITIRKAAPEAEEVISYQMAAFRFHRILVYFAGFKNHIGFYPGASGIEAFKKELSVYKSGKGSVQFPLDKPIPTELITRIVKFRVNENLNLLKTKKK